jgi:hypothetical protein
VAPWGFLCGQCRPRAQRREAAAPAICAEDNLYAYTPASGKVKRIDSFKRKIAALEMGLDGYLLKRFASTQPQLHHV